jgi:hypothetical protein
MERSIVNSHGSLGQQDEAFVSVGKQLFSIMCHGECLKRSVKALDDAGIYQLDFYLNSLANNEGVVGLVHTLVLLEAKTRFFHLLENPILPGTENVVSNGEANQLGEEVLERAEGYDSAFEGSGQREKKEAPADHAYLRDGNGGEM